MITVFLSHSSKDKDKARRIAENLARYDIKVWFDEWEIKVGESITQKIEKGLQDADFVAVLLTKHSVSSRWVEKEWQGKIGEEAESGKVIILPLRAEICSIPYLLKDKRYADFVKDFDSGVKELVSAIKTYTKEREMVKTSSAPINPNQQMREFPVGGINTPCFFPSISGAAKNSLSPVDHLNILLALRHPLFLVSAFDIEHTDESNKITMENNLKRASINGQIILLDSGLYEKRWLRVKRWPKPTFHKILKKTPCHVAFGYDTLHFNRKTTTDEIVDEITRAVILDRKKGAMNVMVPIVHTKYIPDFSVICSKLLLKLATPLIAIPERELGESVIEVAETIRSIRAALDATGKNCLIHILGAGNPLSILIYTACGADSFDGLDWCQTVVDHDTGRLFHSMQLDFFAGQTDYSTQKSLPYLTRLFAHNLVFYENWMRKIRSSIKEGNIIDLINEFVPASCSDRIQNLLST